MSGEDPFDSSRARSLVEGAFPAPVARAFARLAAAGDDPQPAVDLLATLVRYLGLVFLRDLLARPERWTADFTGELLNVLWILEATVATYPLQADLLERIVGQPLVAVE